MKFARHRAVRIFPKRGFALLVQKLGQDRHQVQAQKAVEASSQVTSGFAMIKICLRLRSASLTARMPRPELRFQGWAKSPPGPAQCKGFCESHGSALATGSLHRKPHTVITQVFSDAE